MTTIKIINTTKKSILEVILIFSLSVQKYILFVFFEQFFLTNGNN